MKSQGLPEAFCLLFRRLQKIKSQDVAWRTAGSVNHARAVVIKFRISSGLPRSHGARRLEIVSVHGAPHEKQKGALRPSSF